jgi:drug/metabolite transporter (DMT)-like permease
VPKWLVYSTVSMLIWALWSLLSPLASQNLSGSMVQILSSFGLVPFALLLLFSKNVKKYSHLGKGVLLALATGITAGLGNVMLYNAMGLGGPASLVFPIISMAPLVPVVLAPFLFHEKIRGLQAFAVVVALVAIVLLNTTASSSASAASPDFFSKWMVYTILSLVIFGITFLTQKGATYFISEELCTIVFAVGFLLLDVILITTDRSLTWTIPAKAGWVSVFIGLLMGAGSMTLFAAYRCGKASIVTPYSQLFPIITVVVAVPLYHERIDVLRGIGIVAALFAGIILSLEKSEQIAASEAVAD